MATTTRHRIQPHSFASHSFQVSRRFSRNRIRFTPHASKGPSEEDTGFSLKDNETLVNIGVAGVLGTAVIVGGALVIFNPYAKQEVNQETIEVAVVPEPFGVSKDTTSSQPQSPAGNNVQNLSPAPSVQEAPPPVTPPPPPVPTSSLPIDSKKPLVSSSEIGAGKTSNTGVGTIAAVCALVAAVGGGVVLYGKATTEDDQDAQVKEASMGTTSPASTGAADESNEAGSQEAKEWIANWKSKQ
eukprot:g7799.t1